MTPGRESNKLGPVGEEHKAERGHMDQGEEPTKQTPCVTRFTTVNARPAILKDKIIEAWLTRPRPSDKTSKYLHHINKH